MFSHEQAMEQATQAIGAHLQARASAALAWIAYAAEVRASGVLAGERLTLHDIEARTCEHDGLVAISIRDKRIGGWWLHPDDHTQCE